MKPRHIAMGAALLLAAGLVVFGDNAPDTGLAEPVERAAPVAASPSPAARVREEKDESGRQDWTPPPPPPAPAPAPPPPSAPPLPFTFIGKSLQDGVWQVYLARGDRTYLVRDKEVIDGTYRVDAIKPPVLTLTYLPLDKVQQLNIGVFD